MDINDKMDDLFDKFDKLQKEQELLKQQKRDTAS
jgi:hypothetical protein